jgi:hypothetical protein
MKRKVVRNNKSSFVFKQLEGRERRGKREEEIRGREREREEEERHLVQIAVDEGNDGEQRGVDVGVASRMTQQIREA